jgi:ADP-ribosylglycohydrolase
MLGAIVGDVFGASYEFRSFKEEDFEHSIRLAISLNGDADTQAAITGGVAEAFWGGVPERLETEVRDVLEEPLLEILDRFTKLYRT